MLLVGDNEVESLNVDKSGCALVPKILPIVVSEFSDTSIAVAISLLVLTILVVVQGGPLASSTQSLLVVTTGTNDVERLKPCTTSSTVDKFADSVAT